MISRYMVLVASGTGTVDDAPVLQIYAVKAIVGGIHRHCGDGYIWHHR